MSAYDIGENTVAWYAAPVLARGADTVGKADWNQFAVPYCGVGTMIADFDRPPVSVDPGGRLKDNILKAKALQHS